MKTETFCKRVKSAFTKKGTLNKRYSSAVNYISHMANNEKIYPYFWRRSKGHCNLSGENDAFYIKELCKALGVELKSGNDAPRGGQQGTFFYLDKKDRNKLKGVDFSQIK